MLVAWLGLFRCLGVYIVAYVVDFACVAGLGDLGVGEDAADPVCGEQRSRGTEGEGFDQ